MSPESVIDLGQNALYIIFVVSAPMLFAGMLVGLVVSIFQAATQINEQTLSFVPKIVAVMVSLLFFGPWIIRILVDFTTNIFTKIATVGI